MNQELSRITHIFTVARLDEVLDAIALECLKHTRELLATDKSEDDKGNTAETLLEFNRRIKHLSKSAKRQNRKFRRSEGIYVKRDYAEKVRHYKEDYNEDDIE